MRVYTVSVYSSKMSAISSDSNLKPAIKPPPGLTSNLVDPPSQGYVTITVMVVMLSFTTPIVAIRDIYEAFYNKVHVVG